MIYTHSESGNSWWFIFKIFAGVTANIAITTNMYVLKKPIRIVGGTKYYACTTHKGQFDAVSYDANMNFEFELVYGQY